MTTSTTTTGFGVWDVTDDEANHFRFAYFEHVALIQLIMAGERETGRNTTAYRIRNEQLREAESRMITYVHAYAINKRITFVMAFSTFLKAIGL
jgi:hypothetical protein